MLVLLPFPNGGFLTIHSQKKRYKSCHWGCTFSKGTLLYLKGAYRYLNGTMVLAPKIYISTLKMYILTPKMYILAHKMYILRPKMYPNGVVLLPHFAFSGH